MVTVLNLRKLAAIDILFLGFKLVVTEYAFGVVGSGGLGTLVLSRSHSIWAVAFGIYLITLGINYVPMFLYALSIATKDKAQAELDHELTEKRKAMSKYRRLSLLLLIPFLPPILAIMQLR